MLGHWGQKNRKEAENGGGHFPPPKPLFLPALRVLVQSLLACLFHILNAILIFYLTKTYTTHLYARHHPKHFENINSVNSLNNPTDEVHLSDGETEARGH